MSTPAPSTSQGILRIDNKCYQTTGGDGAGYIGLRFSEGLNILGLVITLCCILIFGAIAISSKNSLAIVMLVCCCSSMAGGIWNEIDIRSKQDAIIARSPATPCTSPASV